MVARESGFRGVGQRRVVAGVPRYRVGRPRFVVRGRGLGRLNGRQLPRRHPPKNVLLPQVREGNRAPVAQVRHQDEFLEGLQAG